MKGITDLFEAETRHVGGTWWVMESAHNPRELEALLDRVEARDPREVLFPDNWEAECRRIFEATGRKPRLGGHIRGPVTAATSIYGVREPDLLDH
ncbi:MAG: hypothetical protein M5U09_19330 [Gammaproteobacteria bacterium]|nr:hypothetical protein [Gammaproteobacteria bacterium]